MKQHRGLVAVLAWSANALTAGAVASASPHANCGGVTYEGIHANQVEAFVGIRFANDTSGANRFKPPVPYIPPAGSIIQANTPGPACSQKLSSSPPTPAHLPSNATLASEDCLRLNVWRPNGTTAADKLPVLVYIYGGSFIDGNKDEEISQPGGMILNAIQNGHPIMNVELNYRLGVFGFAQSGALKKEGSENAGVRDQRLALEWVHHNIAAFGGDPDRITIHGQSSGGLAVGIQIMAYGGAQGFPFQQAICESQALEPGITGNATRASMLQVANLTNCDQHPFDSPETLECLRNLPEQQLLQAQNSVYAPGETLDNGNNWLPVVDGDFLPAAPSTLIAQRRFATKMTTMIGWCDNDFMLFIPTDITTPNDTYTYLHEYLDGMSEANLLKLLALYPISEFSNSYFPNGTINLSAEAYRLGRICRDVLFTCQPIHYGQAIAAAGNTVYLYNQNQSLLTPFLAQEGRPGLGVVHTSELVYVFGNISKFDIPPYPYNPTAEDFRLQTQESNSWSSFAALGRPSLPGHATLQGWQPADFNDPNYGVFVIGGPTEGYSGRDGNAAARKVMAREQLDKRCGFLNSPQIIKQLQY